MGGVQQLPDGLSVRALDHPTGPFLQPPNAMINFVQMHNHSTLKGAGSPKMGLALSVPCWEGMSSAHFPGRTGAPHAAHLPGALRVFCTEKNEGCHTPVRPEIMREAPHNLTQPRDLKRVHSSSKSRVKSDFEDGTSHSNVKDGAPLSPSGCVATPVTRRRSLPRPPQTSPKTNALWLMTGR